MLNIALIGCTGNIGMQTAQIVRTYPSRFRFSALVCGKNGGGLALLKEEFSPRVALRADELPADLSEIFSDCDVALIAASGFAGLRYTLAAVKAGKRVALANKESLVCGGELVNAAVKKYGAEIVPVDSEHSALFRALGCKKETPFERLVLTASGGPFLRKSREELERVTVKEALAHPTWNMGAKITVDSATMLNKGYEVIEAHHLYNAPYERIEAVVHPESIVHSAVIFQDGSMLAQLGYPDMRVPIQFALTYPESLPCEKPLDFSSLGALHFERLPEEKFPCYSLALRAGREGGTSPAIVNGAAEVAVRAFLEGSISFPRIAETIERTVCRVSAKRAETYDDIAEADAQARRVAGEIVHAF